jgi:hypothetical protein
VFTFLVAILAGFSLDTPVLMCLLCWPGFALLGPLDAAGASGCGHFTQEYIDALKGLAFFLLGSLLFF